MEEGKDMGASVGPGCEPSASTADGVLAESHPSRVEGAVYAAAVKGRAGGGTFITIAMSRNSKAEALGEALARARSLHSDYQHECEVADMLEFVIECDSGRPPEGGDGTAPGEAGQSGVSESERIAKPAPRSILQEQDNG